MAATKVRAASSMRHRLPRPRWAVLEESATWRGVRRASGTRPGLRLGPRRRGADADPAGRVQRPDLAPGRGRLAGRSGHDRHGRGPAAPAAVMVGARFAPGAGGPAFDLALEWVRDQRLPLPACATRTWRRGGGAARAAGRRDPEGPSRARRPRRCSRPPAAWPRTRGSACPALAGELGLSRAPAASPLPRRCRVRAEGAGSGCCACSASSGRSDAGERDLARLAAEHGFADQAHLTGECTELAGLTPAALGG